MFSKWFGTKKPYKAIHNAAGRIVLLGEPGGEAIVAVKSELAAVLAAEGNVSRAFLSRIRYSGEDKVRIALIIDGCAPAEQMAAVLVPACQPIAAMDIIFFDALPSHLIENLQASICPFFPPPESDNKLFLIHVHVGRGSNTDMPREFVGALVPVFVAASDHQAAALEAAKQLKDEGFEFLDVPDRKIYQLDPLDWQSYVKNTWPEFEDELPSQELVLAGVPYGQVFFGPFGGYERRIRDDH